MTIAPEVLALLRCPATRQPLKVATAEMIRALEARRLEGSLRDEVGTIIESEITGGLVREDELIFYTAPDNIPVLIAGEGISLG